MLFEKILNLNQNDPNIRSKVISYLQLVESVSLPLERSKAFTHLGKCLITENPLLAAHCLQLAIAWGAPSSDITPLLRNIISESDVEY